MAKKQVLNKKRQARIAAFAAHNSNFIFPPSSEKPTVCSAFAKPGPGREPLLGGRHPAVSGSVCVVVALARTVVLALVLATQFSQSLRAQEVPLGVSWGVGETVEHDNNLTRANAQSPYPILSATSYLTGLTGMVHETYGREDVTASATIARALYPVYSQYDITQQDIRGTLLSNLPLSTEAVLTLERTSQMAHFADLGSPIRDVIYHNEVNASIDFPLTVNWRAVVTGDDGRTLNSASIFQTQDLNTTEVDGGIRFQPSTGNHVDLLLRTVHGTYPNGSPSVFISPGYNDRGADLRADWTFTGASHLMGRAGYIERRNDDLYYLDTTTFPFQVRELSRNFSGPGFDLTYIWQATGASKITAYGLRQIGAAGDNNYLSAVTRTFRLAPAYQPSVMFAMEAYFEWSLRDYFSDVYSVVTGLPPGTTRRDNSHNAGISVVWNPRRWLQAKLDLRREQRDSTISSWVYTDSNASLSLQCRF